MNTKEFVQVLRKIIKEEVKSAVKEAINDISTTNLVESIQDTTVYDYKPKKKQVSSKQFVSDPLLNSLLNETAAQGVSIPPDLDHNDYSEWPELKMNSYANLMGSPKYAQKIDATPAGIPPSAVPEEVKTALTRDYRSLMKAIDKKKGNK